MDLHFKFDQAHKEVKRYAELLEIDPSDFSVVDAMVKDNDVNFPYPTLLVKEWVLAGAQIAQKIYKTIYPQAQEFFPPLA